MQFETISFAWVKVVGEEMLIGNRLVYIFHLIG